MSTGEKTFKSEASKDEVFNRDIGGLTDNSVSSSAHGRGHLQKKVIPKHSDPLPNLFFS